MIPSRLLKSKFKVLFTLVSFHTSSAETIWPLTPNRNWTPGSYCTTTNPHFVKFRYSERIAVCKRATPGELRTRIYELYAIRPENKYKYTVDHLIPLSMGGDNSEKNLWPEHKAIKATRFNLELNVQKNLDFGLIDRASAVKTILDEKFHPSVAPNPNFVIEDNSDPENY